VRSSRFARRWLGSASATFDWMWFVGGRTSNKRSWHGMRLAVQISTDC